MKVVIVTKSKAFELGLINPELERILQLNRRHHRS